MIEWILMLFFLIRIWMIFVTSKVFIKQLTLIRQYKNSGDGLNNERLNYITFSVLLLALHTIMASIDVIEFFSPGNTFLHETPVYAGLNIVISSLLTYQLSRLYKE